MRMPASRSGGATYAAAHMEGGDRRPRARIWTLVTMIGAFAMVGAIPSNAQQQAITFAEEDALSIAPGESETAVILNNTGSSIVVSARAVNARGGPSDLVQISPSEFEEVLPGSIASIVATVQASAQSQEVHHRGGALQGREPPRHRASSVCSGSPGALAGILGG